MRWGKKKHYQPQGPSQGIFGIDLYPEVLRFTIIHYTLIALLYMIMILWLIRSIGACDSSLDRLGVVFFPIFYHLSLASPLSCAACWYYYLRVDIKLYPFWPLCILTPLALLYGLSALWITAHIWEQLF